MIYDSATSSAPCIYDSAMSSLCSWQYNKLLVFMSKIMTEQKDPVSYDSVISSLYLGQSNQLLVLMKVHWSPCIYDSAMSYLY